MVPVTWVEPAFLVNALFPTSPPPAFIIYPLRYFLSSMAFVIFFFVEWLFNFIKVSCKTWYLVLNMNLHKLMFIYLYLLCLRHYGIELGSTASESDHSTRQRNWFVVLPMAESSPQPAWTGNPLEYQGSRCTLFYRPTHSGAWAESKASGSPHLQDKMSGPIRTGNSSVPCVQLWFESTNMSLLALGMFLLPSCRHTALPTAGA